MSQLGFGCVALTKHSFEKDALRILDIAYEMGINYFDTAPLYGQGYSEKILGKFMQGKRAKITLATKFGLGNVAPQKLIPKIALPLHHLIKKLKKTIPVIDHQITEPSPIPYRIIDKKLIEQSFTNSLRSLKTDHINNYLLHEALPSFLTDEALEYLISLKEQKIIGQLGIASGFINLQNIGAISDFNILQYEGTLPYAKESDFYHSHFDKTHIHHSVLKPLKLFAVRNIEEKDAAGWILLNALKKERAKYVLFSTTNKKNLANNLKLIEENRHLDYSVIKRTITDAFY